MKEPNSIVFKKSTYLNDNVSNKHIRFSANLLNQSKPKTKLSSHSLDNKASQLIVAYSLNNQSTQAVSSTNNYSAKSVTNSVHNKPKLFGAVDNLYYSLSEFLMNSKIVNLKNIMSISFFMSGMLLMFYMVHFM